MQKSQIEIKFDNQNRIICDQYHAKIPPKTCIARQDIVVMRSIYGGKIIDWINDVGCQNCEIGRLLTEKNALNQNKSDKIGINRIKKGE